MALKQPTPVVINSLDRFIVLLTHKNVIDNCHKYIDVNDSESAKELFEKFLKPFFKVYMSLKSKYDFSKSPNYKIYEDMLMRIKLIEKQI